VGSIGIMNIMLVSVKRTRDTAQSGRRAVRHYDPFLVGVSCCRSSAVRQAALAWPATVIGGAVVLI
jgi:hypothetical protein